MNAEGAYSMERDLTDNDAFQKAKTVFARVCVWSSGADQGIYSPVVRLK